MLKDIFAFLMSRSTGCVRLGFCRDAVTCLKRPLVSAFLVEFATYSASIVMLLFIL